MSDTINALQMLNQPHGGGQLPAPAIINPLAAYSGAMQTAGQVYQLRQAQANQAVGQALQAATDPQTGIVDYPKFQRIAAGMPQAAMAMQQGLTTASQLTGEQQINAVRQMHAAASTMPTLLVDPSDDNVNNVATMMKSSGMNPDYVEQERQRLLSMPPGQRVQEANRFLMSSLNGLDQFRRTYGDTTLQDVGGRIQPMQVFQGGPGYAGGGGPVGPGVTKTLTPGESTNIVSMQGPDGKTHYYQVGPLSAATGQPQLTEIAPPGGGGGGGGPGNVNIPGRYTPDTSKPSQPALQPGGGGGAATAAPATPAPQPTPNSPTVSPPAPAPGGGANALLPVPPTPPAAAPPLSGNALTGLAAAAPPAGTAIGGGQLVMPSGAVISPPGGIPAPPGVPKPPAAPVPAQTPAPTVPAAKPPLPEIGASATPGEQEMFNTAVAARGPNNQMNVAGQSALELLESIPTTGPYTDRVNAMMSTLQAHGLMPAVDPKTMSPEAAYQALGKEMLSFAQNSAGQVNNTDLGLETSLKSNANVERMLPAANRYVLLQKLGQVRMNQALLNGQDPSGVGFRGRSQNYTTKYDPTAFVWDYMNPPEQQDYIKSLGGKDSAAYQKWVASMKEARDTGVWNASRMPLVPRSGQQAGQ